MGKRSNDLSDKGDTRVLYKKSMSTIRTRSKTYSGHSQVFTKSGIEQLKKEISQTNTFSTHCDKEKKDLAVETNVCMLRNHYIRKRIKQSQRDTSTRSKFSTLTNVKDTAGSSASGDSKQNPEEGDNARKNIDIVSIIVDNFKGLLNKWICENILGNISENYPKLDTVRDSLLHKLERNAPKENPSRTTFVYHSKVHRNHPKCFSKAQKTYSSTRKTKEKIKFVGKFSRYTIPFQCRKVRLVSTLSIPRDFEKSSHKSEETHDDTLYKLRKMSHNVYLSLVKPKELLVGSSTFDLLVMSSRSLTKRCATYKIDNGEKKNFSKKVAFESQVPDCQSKTKSKFAMKNNSAGNTTPPKQGFDNVPSLVKSIYGDTNPSYVFLMSDNYTMTEYSSTPTENRGSESSEYNTSHGDKHCETNLKSEVLSEKDRSDPMITIDFISQSLEFPPLKIVTSNTPNNNLRKKAGPKNHRSQRKRACARNRKPKNNVFNTDNFKSKHFTYLYKKVNRMSVESNEFLNHLQNILKYFAEKERDKNMRLDVQVNVFPIAEKSVSNSKTECNGVEKFCNTNSLKSELTPTRKELDTLIESLESDAPSKRESIVVENKSKPEIISLLDGALSEAKYILKNDTPIDSFTNNEKHKHKDLGKVSDCSTVTTGLEISQEINELKSVIKGLAVTTEKLMSVHLHEKHCVSPKKSPVETTVLYNPNTATVTSSESSQVASEPKTSRKNNSKGIQISDDFIRDNTQPDFKLKKDTKKLDKTELNARLMAKSTTYRFIESESILKVTDMTSLENNAKGPNDVGLTCSFPKSKSLFEVTTEKENPKLMAFYCEGIFRKPGRAKTDCSSSGLSSCRLCDPKGRKSSLKEIERPASIRTIELIRSPKSCGDYDDDLEEGRNLMDDEAGDDCPKCRRSVGFYEGFLYCMIIWVPIIIILILFYLCIIKKNLPKKVAPSIGGNNTLQYLKLSDLGF